jgi:hypothetical protein
VMLSASGGPAACPSAASGSGACMIAPAAPVPGKVEFLSAALVSFLAGAAGAAGAAGMLSVAGGRPVSGGVFRLPAAAGRAGWGGGTLLLQIHWRSSACRLQSHGDSAHAATGSSRDSASSRRGASRFTRRAPGVRRKWFLKSCGCGSFTQQGEVVCSMPACWRARGKIA